MRTLCGVLILCCFLSFSIAKDVEYTFEISWVKGNPDGVTKQILAANGQFPGPTIELEYGDTLVLNINNRIDPPDFTSIHFHGLNHNWKPEYTPFMDGVQAVSQCGIPPNKDFQYKFKPQQHGTFWWHSHTGTQYVDGLFGMIIIHHNNSKLRSLYDVDKEQLILSDLYHEKSEVLLERYLSPPSEGAEPIPDSGLISGLGQYNCSMTTKPCHSNKPKFELHVQKGKTYRLRILNASAFAQFHLSVDNHKLSIVDADGTEVQPHPVQVLSVAIAQRYSVILYANQTVGNYWIRAKMLTHDLGNPNLTIFNPHVYGIVRYDSAPSGNPTTLDWTIPRQILNVFDLEPVDVEAAPAVTKSIVLNITQVEDPISKINYLGINDVMLFLWNVSTPILIGSYEGHRYYNSSGVIDLPISGEVIELVINNLDNGDHPMHLHGHEFSVIGVGNGTYNPHNPSNVYSLANPLRRDTTSVSGNSWLLLRFTTGNPGAWLFHCHIDWHLEAGLAVVFNELQPTIRSLLKIPESMLKKCREDYSLTV